ncbi:hypothetical protein HDV62DRAFT_114153 [Trichoderma sp. SZMC 28011]
MSVELSVGQSRPLPPFTPPALQDWQPQPFQHSLVIFVLLPLLGFSAHLSPRTILRVLHSRNLFLLVAQTLPLLCSFHHFTFQTSWLSKPTSRLMLFAVESLCSRVSFHLHTFCTTRQTRGR